MEEFSLFFNKLQNEMAVQAFLQMDPQGASSLACVDLASCHSLLPNNWVVDVNIENIDYPIALSSGPPILPPSLPAFSATGSVSVPDFFSLLSNFGRRQLSEPLVARISEVRHGRKVHLTDFLAYQQILANLPSLYTTIATAMDIKVGTHFQELIFRSSFSGRGRLVFGWSEASRQHPSRLAGPRMRCRHRLPLGQGNAPVVFGPVACIQPAVFLLVGLQSGALSKDDFKVACRVLNRRFSRLECDVVFELFDLDNDGFISADDCRCPFLIPTPHLFSFLQDLNKYRSLGCHLFPSSFHGAWGRTTSI